MYHLTEAYLMSTLICLFAAFLGALVYGSSVIPATIIRVLGESGSATLLRTYWSTYHRFAVFAGTAFTATIAAGSNFSAVPAIYSLLVVTLCGTMTVLFLFAWRLIPAINAARDAGDPKRFKRLHRIDIALVGGGMLLALVVLATLVYVLPGHFTYYPTEIPTLQPAGIVV
jgi:hypothetical protein